MPSTLFVYAVIAVCISYLILMIKITYF